MSKQIAWPLTYRESDATIRTGDDDEMIADLYLTEDQEYLGPLFAAAPELRAACKALGAFTRDLLKLVTSEQIKAAKLERRMLKVSEQGFKALAKARGEATP